MKYAEQDKDWIVIASNGNFLVVDNEQLQQDGIIAHALHSVHKSCAEAKLTQQELINED